MQHLSILASWASAAANPDERRLRVDTAAREMENALLDFSSANPLGYGACWASPMDVGIRAVAILVAWDLLAGAGAKWREGIEGLIGRMILEHGRHILTNLEWSSTVRGNHFLADIAALTIIGRHLPPTKEVVAWLAFARAALLEELDTQFGNDGANFESSTSYHRLCSEMVSAAIAALVGVDAAVQGEVMGVQVGFSRIRVLPSVTAGVQRNPQGDFVPSMTFDKLARIAKFSVDITKPNGVAVQIGDNDSGRFIAASLATPATADAFGANWIDSPSQWAAQSLDHRPAVAACNAHLGREDLGRFADGRWAEADVITAWRGRVPLLANRESGGEGACFRAIGDEVALAESLAASERIPRHLVPRWEFQLPNASIDEAELVAYTDFGLFLLRGRRVFVSIRCGRVGTNGLGVHAHNDQLSLELQVDGRDIVTDPGSFCYSRDPKERNKYRSVHAHFAPSVSGREPANLSKGMFCLPDAAKAKCRYFGRFGFVGSHWGYGYEVTRVVNFDRGTSRVVVVDYFRDWRAAEAAGIALSNEVESIPFSPGYGVKS